MFKTQAYGDAFKYPCPDCESITKLHEIDCEYENVPRWQYEKAYIDIISQLVAYSAVMDMHDAPPGMSFKMLARKVSKELSNHPDPEKRGEWRSIHEDCLHALKDHHRVGEAKQMGGLFLKTPEERAQDIIPTFDPIQTIYETGPVDGAKDYAVYSMVSWCELVGLNWNQTVNFLTEWLEDTKSWEELSWSEGSIKQLLTSKKHVHDKGLGWGDYAEIAAGHIRNSKREPRIDAQAKANTVEKEDYDQ